ncbi:hypothetical protein [Streptomyces scabiei]|uniref:hypothetical protein n=1 Tax=Streptomyces scabiei TaxID=1930 RepID=UPI0029BB293A|nr:hypothetical protein [Streptomyces scabiei]MDX3523328.1 hypothetical protein [Streptomyces scabiei]
MTHPTAVPLAAASLEPALLFAAAAVLTVLAVSSGVWLIRRRPTRIGRERPTAPAVWVAALAAIGCTAYSADTSWRFAADYLDMAGTTERAAMFAAAELALFATALMARQNLTSQGAPGLPGVLVWVITGVQVIPAYAESGPIGGTVRAFVGPVMAAMLWHQAMGIELRLHKPGASSHGVMATLGREARERLLSRLGIAERDRDAAQITRERATARAVTLATRLAGRTPKQRGNWRGRCITRRLQAALARADVGTEPQQLRILLDQLAARRHATALATVELPSPWTRPLLSQPHVRRDQPSLAPHQVAVGDQVTSECHAVPEAGPVTKMDSPRIRDRPEEGHMGPALGTEPAGDGDRPRPVPETGDRGAAGDQASAVPDTEDAQNGDEASEGGGDKTAAQGSDIPSRAPFPYNGDHDVPRIGTGAGTESTGDRPQTVPARRRPKASRTRSRGGQGKSSRRQPQLSVDQLVTQLRPHVPKLLERDGNAEVTRTQLREIMRAHNIGIRNDRLTPVLERLRREAATSTTKKRSAG